MVQLLLFLKIVLKSKIRLFLAGIIVISSLSSEARTCSESFRFTFEQEMIREFMQEMDAQRLFGAGIFAREMSFRTPHYIDLSMPRAVVTIRSYDSGARRVFEVTEINPRGGYESAVDTIFSATLYTLIRGAQRYQRTFPENQGVQLIFPIEGSISVTQMAFGFYSNGGRRIYLDLTPLDIQTSTR